MKHIPFIDSSALVQLIGFIKKSRFIFTEFWPDVKENSFESMEFAKQFPKEKLFKGVKEALKYIEKINKYFS